MKIAIFKDGQEYFLTNENLKIGDKVFPMLETSQRNGHVFITEIINLKTYDEKQMIAYTGWPSEPHTILRFYWNGNGIEYIQTDRGYSPSEIYFKEMEFE